MQKLLAAMHAAASDRDWSRGVELSRAGAVIGKSRTAEEIVVQVAVKGAAVSPTVTLWPEDAEWSCDCDSRAEACFHAAAAVIAVKRAAEAGQELPVAGGRTGQVGYRFTRSPEGLRFVRVRTVDGVDERPLSHSLAMLTSGRVEGPAIAASKADTAVDLALAAFIKPAPTLMPAPLARKVLPLLARCDDVKLDGAAILVAAVPAGFFVRVKDEEAGFRLGLVRDPAITEVFPGNFLALAGDTLHVWDTAWALSGADKWVLDAFAEIKKGLVVGPERVAWLVSELLPALRSRLRVDEKTERLPKLKEGHTPRVVIETAQAGESLMVLPTLVYGEPAVARVDGDRLVVLGKVLPRRDEPAEARALLVLKRVGLQVGQRVVRAGEEAIALAEKLRAAGVTLRGEAHHAFKRMAAVAPRIGAGGLSFVTGEGDDAREADARAVVAAWQRGEEMVPLLGGGYAPLPHDWLTRYGPQVALLLAAKGERGEVASYAKPALADLYAALETPAPPELAGLAALARDFAGVPAAQLPADLTASLRGYQRRGVDWLCCLRDAGLGAMLADDMGLGKTLQCITALRGRCLVVAPTSVLHNWAAEARRFRPGLRVCTYHGPRRELDADAELVLTSYAILRLDIEKLTEETWDVVVLDEAQTIKNADSQVARAAYRLSARWRVTLSGTPVENRLEELWSQFHFLNPGLLGGRQDFIERHARPIAEGRAGAAAGLRGLVRPFLLRRRKQEVAKELPPRTEVVLRCTLSEAERKVYDAIHAATEKEVVAALAAGGGVLAALEALLRLRQAACHAGLVPGQSLERSSKLELLLTTLEEAAAAGHRALVFSQWTGLLDRVEPLLRASGLGFVRLDGATRDRAGAVAQFQAEDGPPVMLVSLKAGGTGLNLTAADHVFLLDPWWNPAVEDQAADRAHRIGQTRPVLVHKLVAEDTVETRILELQQRKRALADAALEGADAAASLTRDDLLALLA